MCLADRMSTSRLIPKDLDARSEELAAEDSAKQH